MKLKYRYGYRKSSDPPLVPMVAVSLAVHLIFIGFFFLMPSRSTAGDGNVYEIQEVNLVYTNDIGAGGVWGTPKKGPANDGKITIPPQAQPVQIPSTSPTDAVRVDEKKNEPKKNNNYSSDGADIPDDVRKAIDEFNKGRNGEFTRPDGDPNGNFAGPSGPPGGNPCSIYRSRIGRQIRRSGSVPEAAGKTATLRVVVGSAGTVVSKSIISSSGVPHADSVALSLVPGSFGAPPAECGNIPLTVRVSFRGKSDSAVPISPSDDRPRSTTPPRPKSKSDDAIDKALDDL